MSVARRNDGRYVVKYKDEQGRWKQRSFRNEAEARRFDSECAYDETENERPTLMEAVLAYLKNKPLSESSVRQYRFLVCGHDRRNGAHSEGPAECLADKFADELTRRDLETVRENCRARNMSPASINLCTGKLKATLSWCAEQELLHENPWGKYRALPAKHESRQGTLKDFQKIYAVLPDWLKWACRTALALCLRPGLSELFSLRWSAFNFEQGAVAVYMGKTGATKTVYPPERYMSEARTRWEADGMDGSMLVCRNRSGGEVKYTAYRAAWERAKEKSGVAMPMYALRHIAASQMLAAGADLVAVAAQLGHANPATTGRYYAHVLPESQKAAGSTLGLVHLGADEEEKSSNNK